MPDDKLRLHVVYTAEEREARFEAMEAEKWAKENPREAAREAAVEKEIERLAIHDDARRTLDAKSAAGVFPGFEGLSLRDALAVPRVQVPSLIEGLQKRGHKATLVAPFKTGKTTFVGNVIRSLVDTVPLLDRFEVPPLDGNVVVFDYELTRDDALEMYDTLNIHNSQRVHVESLRGTGFSLANDHHAELARDFLKSREAAYWVLDPFGRAMRGFGEENSNDDVRGFLMKLDEIVAESGVQGVLLPVHTGRALADVGAERARGASVLDDDPDVRWILTRNSDQMRFFRAEGRSGIDVPEFALQYDPTSSRLSATTTTRQEAAGERFWGPVLDYVTQHPGCSVNDVKSGVSGKDVSVRAALKRLVSEGGVVTARKGSATVHYLPTDLPKETP